MLGPRATVAIASVVTVVWATNFVAGITVAGYEPDQSINGIFMAIVGGVIALRRPPDRDDKAGGGTG